MAALYYRGVDCAIIVYDISNRRSYEEVRDYWVHELRQQVGVDTVIKICIAGNKSDLHLERQVSELEGKTLAEEHGASFFETSAKNNENIFDMFVTLGMDLPERTTSASFRRDRYALDTEPRSLCC